MNVFIVDDHPLFIAGIRTLLDEEKDITILGEASDGLQAIEKIRKINPDVVIMDISMPQMDGFEATRQLLSEHKDLKIIALSIHSGKRYVKEMLDSGAVGYLVKDSAPEDLVQAIRKVVKGEMFLSSAITSIVLDQGDADSADIKDADSHILRTKLHRPPLSDDLVLRTEIIKRLEENCSKPLTLVSAGAGYGKSIIVSQWLENTNCQHTWLTLDEEHNDLRIFLTYLIAAVEKIPSTILKKTRSLIQMPELPSLSFISQTLINELDAIEQAFILVLDDYHRIEEEPIHELLNELLRFPPENMNLTLISRRDPPLGLSKLRGHGRINEIRIDKLLFKAEDVNSLFQNLYGLGLDDQVIDSVLERTEGWIAGIRLAALLISSAEDVESLMATMKGDSRLVSDFLIEEVLLKQPVQIQDYLLSTSILDNFCAELVDEINIISKPNQKKDLLGLDFIKLLLKSNLFIIPLDDRNEWFRYHHLFQELLYKQLKHQRKQQDIAAMNLRASEWLERSGFIQQAIHHALAADNSDGAADIIERNRHSEINKDRWYVVTQWLDMLSEETKQQRLVLMLAHAFSLFEQFRLLEMIPILEQVEAKMLAENVEPALKGETYFYRGYVSIYINGDGNEALKQLKEAKRLIPESYQMIRGEIEMYMAIALQMTGKEEMAIKSLEEKIRTGDTFGDLIYSRLLAGLVFMHLHSGHLKTAYNTAIRLATMGKQANLLYVEAFGQYAAANNNLNSFDLQEAFQGLSFVVRNKGIVNAKISVDAMAGLILTCQFLGRTDKAMTILEQLIEFTQNIGAASHIDIALSSKARIILLQGKSDEALEWARSYITEPHVPSMNFWLENPVITKSRILITAGTDDEIDKALQFLDSLVKQIDNLHNTYQKLEILVLQSVALEKLGRTDDALTVLEEVLDLAIPGGWIRPFVEPGSMMTDMLKRLVVKDTYRDFINLLTGTIEKQQDVAVSHVQVNSDSEAVPVTAKVSGGRGGHFTTRELEVLELLSKGFRNKEIATELYLSTETVKRHLYNIFQKLNVSSRMHAISKSKELGIIS